MFVFKEEIRKIPGNKYIKNGVSKEMAKLEETSIKDVFEYSYILHKNILNKPR